MCRRSVASRFSASRSAHSALRRQGAAHHEPNENAFAMAPR
jgi:hypothetical protein